MSHYYAKEFFAPVLLSPYVDKDDGNMRVSLINDLLLPVTNGMHIQVFDYMSGFAVRSNSNVKVNQAPQGASIVYEETVDHILQRSKCERAADCFVVVSMDSPEDGSYTAVPNVMLLGPPKHASIPKATVKVRWITRFVEFIRRLMLTIIASFETWPIFRPRIFAWDMVVDFIFEHLLHSAAGRDPRKSLIF